MKIEEIRGKPVACRCRSKGGIAKAIEASEELSNEAHFVLLTRADKKVVPRILPAYVNAMIRQGESGMRARSMRMEILLFIAGTMNIGKAIRESGASDPASFIAVSDSEATLSRFLKEAGVEVLERYNLKLDKDVAADVSVTELLDQK